ncbi:hypothetical protein ANANG_G00040110 [Anguilla anguilla]|uniref:C2H2-type domain-containing protein n=2 Tax=Anguilla TaxID=7935 RepID=A0A9D3S4L1_ANGAN|nr:hypothetical protein ANANG_G00040110 [Anguilla anguilla]
MSGSTVTRWVISDDGSHLIRREEVEAAIPKGVESQMVQVKEENFDRPVTNISTSSSLSTNKKNAVPAQLPVSYPCAYCDICFTASHYLEKHVKRSHRKQYLEMLRSRNITFSKTPASTSATLIKTPASTSATFSKAPISTAASFNKAPISTAASFNKAPISTAATFSKTPASTAAT